MKTRRGIFILALILAISGCSKDEPTATGGSGLPSSYLMPDSVGQSWHYSGYKTILGYDTLGNRTDSISYVLSLDIAIISRDTINGYQTFTAEICCRTQKDSGGIIADTGRVRYAQNDTLLAEVAYVPGTPVGPKQKGVMRIRFGGKTYKNIEELRKSVLFGSGSVGKYDTTLIPYDPPRILLDYPLIFGKEWVHYSTAWLSHRKAERFERTLVDGRYDYCWKIRSLLDVDGDGNWDSDIVWHDWYNDSGMIKRHLEMQGTWVGPLGEMLGTIIYIEHYELANP
jgi:hypothetical protein